MSKLLKLKEWLTVADAAKSLTISAGEVVTEADIFRLALDGHLTLSVYFVNYATARAGKIVSYEETKWSLIKPIFEIELPEFDEKTVCRRADPPGLLKLYQDAPEALASGYIPVMASLCIDEDRYINLDDDVTTLKGVWDLPMWGAEGLDVEHEFQSLTGGPEVTLQNLEGAFVQGAENVICQLQENYDDNEFQPGSRAQLEKIKLKIFEDGIEADVAAKMLAHHQERRKKFIETREGRPRSERYHPAGALPSDSVFVVRTSALRELEQSLDSGDEKQEKPLHPSERKSVAQIIAALAAMAELDLSAPYAADETLRAAAAKHLLELPSSPETVTKFLKDAAARSNKNWAPSYPNGVLLALNRAQT
jgi:hypothetical protein